MSEVKLVSVDKQRKKITVTPTGWVVIAVVGLLVAAGVGWGVWKITRGVTVQPLAAAPEVVATVEPTGVPTEVENGEAAIPDLTQVEELARLREHFLEAWMWFYASESPQNPDDALYYFTPLPVGADDWVFTEDPTYWVGLTTVESDLEFMRAHEVFAHLKLEGGDWRVSVERVGSGGQWVVMKARYDGGTCTAEILSTTTGAVQDSAESLSMWYLAGLVYDADDHRWKIASMRQYTAEPDV